MPTVRPTVVALLALSLFGPVSLQPAAVDAADVSDFTKFTFSQEPAFGFCPPVDGVFRASISVEGGTYTLGMSLLEEGLVDSKGNCLSPLEVGPCAREVELLERTLTAEEIVTVRDAFSDISVEGPLRGCGAIDPCRIQVFMWDDDRLSDQPCDERRLPHEQTQAIVDLLEDLRREVRDFSDFTTFEYSQDPAFGFCADPAEIFSASIDASNGDYVLNMSLLEDAFDAEEECFNGPRVDGRRCLVARPIPERILTAGEVADITAAFSEVTVDKHQDPDCPLIDPCRIRNFTWDDETITDSPCGKPRIAWKLAEVLVDALDQLKDPGPPPPPPAFLRGDCDGNGVVGGSPTEAILLLGFAFRNEDEPPCLAACDAEANGSLGVTDAVRILRFAFSGGPPPDPPFPECTESAKATDFELGCTVEDSCR